MCLHSLVLPVFAVAVDGVSEINQACAQDDGDATPGEPGCFDGDTEGFPVTLTQSGNILPDGHHFGPSFPSERVQSLFEVHPSLVSPWR